MQEVAPEVEKLEIQVGNQAARGVAGQPEGAVIGGARPWVRAARSTQYFLGAPHGSRAGLQKLHDSAKNKDNGVARLARQRLDVIKSRLTQGAEADAILSQLEAKSSYANLGAHKCRK